MHYMNLIALTGSPKETGEKYGALNSAQIKADWACFLAKCRSVGLTADDLAARSRTYEKILADVAPAWLEEAHAIASSAQINPGAFLALNSLADHLTPVEKCTSWLAVGKVCGGRNLLHQNLDWAWNTQNVYIRHITGANKYLGAADVSNFGTAYFLNEKGLAGGANCGGPHDDQGNEVGIDDFKTLRLLAERADNCEEALAVLQDIVARGIFQGHGTGNKSGSIFLFVDQNKGLVVEMSAHRLEHQWVKEGYAVRANTFHSNLVSGRTMSEQTGFPPWRQRRVEALLNEKKTITAEIMNAISRDIQPEAGGRPTEMVCNKSTISGLTAEISAEMPGMLSCGWFACGHTRNVVYLPILIGGDGVSAEVVRGELWLKAKALYAHYGSNGVGETQLAAIEQQLGGITEEFVAANRGKITGQQNASLFNEVHAYTAHLALESLEQWSSHDQ